MASNIVFLFIGIYFSPKALIKRFLALPLIKKRLMNFELCTDSVEGAIKASFYGFKSIELCSALAVGGLTPNFGLIQSCVRQSNLEVHVMLRHREGGFVCDQADVDLMKIDIEAVKRAGAHGVVFGLLNEAHKVSDLNLQLVQMAKSLGLKATFHRAFDFVPDFRIAIKKIVAYGFDRLLTSGLESKAAKGLDVINELQRDHGHLIQIIAGSGINAANALIFANSGIKTLHFTARRSYGETTNLGMGIAMLTDEDKINSILSLFT